MEEGPWEEAKPSSNFTHYNAPHLLALWKYCFSTRNHLNTPEDPSRLLPTATSEKGAPETTLKTLTTSKMPQTCPKPWATKKTKKSKPVSDQKETVNLPVALSAPNTHTMWNGSGRTGINQSHSDLEGGCSFSPLHCDITSQRLPAERRRPTSGAVGHQPTQESRWVGGVLSNVTNLGILLGFGRRNTWRFTGNQE